MSIEQNVTSKSSLDLGKILPSVPAESAPDVSHAGTGQKLVKVTPKKRAPKVKVASVSKEEAQSAAREACAYLKQIHESLGPVIQALTATSTGDAYVDSLGKIKTLEDDSENILDVCAKVRQVLATRVKARVDEFG